MCGPACLILLFFAKLGFAVLFAWSTAPLPALVAAQDPACGFFFVETPTCDSAFMASQAK